MTFAMPDVIMAGARIVAFAQGAVTGPVSGRLINGYAAIFPSPIVWEWAIAYGISG